MSDKFNIINSEKAFRESHIRINKLLIEKTDPLYIHRYLEKRGVLSDKIKLLDFEMKRLIDARCRLDEARNNWEPIP